ncbi:MAG: hypothetical protein EA382_02380 [Spirochaetaceae bacterium]|nr:MAG: hypothetical protein EA382_02380 [Spirochaetaceae bacterium]
MTALASSWRPAVRILWSVFSPDEENTVTRLRQLLVVLVLAVLVGCPDPLDVVGGEPTGPGSGSSPTIGALILVPAGSFQRDATPANISEISEPFRMSATEITRAQFTAVMGEDPVTWEGGSTGQDDPVQMVNWFHAIAFCNKLSLQNGLTPVYSVSGVNFATLEFADIPASDTDPAHPIWDAVTVNWSADGYRLPTTMEWMWAAMGADSGAPGAVNTTGYDKPFAGSTDGADIHDYAWIWSNSANTTHSVGTKLPNEIGLFDMSGNVEEWCWDWHEGTYSPGNLDDATYRDREGAGWRVIRNGNRGDSHANNEERQAVAYWDGWHPTARTSYLGFRVVRR